jgi:hypothetical protein
MTAVLDREPGAASNNEKPCTGGSESERSYRWPPGTRHPKNSFLRSARDLPLIQAEETRLISRSFPAYAPQEEESDT